MAQRPEIFFGETFNVDPTTGATISNRRLFFVGGGWGIAKVAQPGEDGGPDTVFAHINVHFVDRTGSELDFKSSGDPHTTALGVVSDERLLRPVIEEGLGLSALV